MGSGSSACPFHVLVISLVFLLKIEGHELATHNVTAIQGETATFSCKAENKENSAIQLLSPQRFTIFFKDVKTLRDKRFQLVSLSDTELQVSLSNVSLSDEGYYVCLLYTRDPIEVYAHLTVLVLPGSPVIESCEDVFREGNQVELTCTSTGGKPAASIRWLKGEEEVSGEATVEDTYDGTFVTSRVKVFVTKEDDGVPVKCIIDHPAVKGLVAQRLLEVLYKPEVKVVVTSPDGLTREGDNLDLACIVKGKPHPHQINWLRLEGGVPSHAVINGSKLHIENLTRHYDGTYRCLASNAEGEAYEDFILNVFASEACKGQNIEKVVIRGVLMSCLICSIIILGRYFDKWKRNYPIHKVKDADADHQCAVEMRGF